MPGAAVSVDMVSWCKSRTLAVAVLSWCTADGVILRTGTWCRGRFSRQGFRW